MSRQHEDVEAARVRRGVGLVRSPDLPDGCRMAVLYSTFFDAFGANLYTESQYKDLLNGSWEPLRQVFQYGSQAATVDQADPHATITVGLVLDRANQPTALLSGNWA